MLYSFGAKDELKGTGVWSFFKVDASPVGRAAVAATLVAVVAIVANPDFVSALANPAVVPSPSGGLTSSS